MKESRNSKNEFSSGDSSGKSFSSTHKKRGFSQIFKSNRGETIVENIASFVIFIGLMVVVSLIINVSLNWTWAGIKRGDEIQDTLNEIIIAQYGGNPDDLVAVTISSDDDIGGSPIIITQEVWIWDDDGFFAFRPGTH